MELGEMPNFFLIRIKPEFFMKLCQINALFLDATIGQTKGKGIFFHPISFYATDDTEKRKGRKE